MQHVVIAGENVCSKGRNARTTNARGARVRNLFDQGEQRPMIRISLPYVFNLCAQLEQILSIAPKDKRGDVVFQLWSTQIAVE